MNGLDYCMIRNAKRAKENSRCLKRNLGCVLYIPKRKAKILGTNGPPLSLSDCGDECPRKDEESGTNLIKCRAIHAERDVLLKAAKKGIPTDGSILFSDMGVPCKDCLLELIHAGVSEIVCTHDSYYDEPSQEILREWIANGGKFRIVSAEDI